MFEQYLNYFESAWSRNTVMVLTIIILTYIAAKLIGFILKHAFNKLTKLEARREGRKMLDRTKFIVTQRFIVALVYIIGVILIFVAIPPLKAASTSILAGAGVLALIIGFATQKTLSNIIAGIFIAFYEPFRIGDRVNIEGEYGTIEDITLRHTVITTWENKSLIIPNAKIDDMSIINYTINDERIMKPLEIGISYDSDIDLARKIITQEVKKHPEVINPPKESKMDSKATVRVISLDDFQVKLRAYFWVRDQSVAFKTSFELLESIKKRFDKEGIEIPFPYRTIVYKKDIKKPKKKKK